MPRRIRISLANKCQLLFGSAVLLILTAALGVVWLRMQSLTAMGPRHRAQDLAAAWLDDQIHLGKALAAPSNVGQPLPPTADLTVSLVDAQDFDRLSKRDAFLRQSIERFQRRPDSIDRFDEALDAQGQPYYRYVRAVRQADLKRLETTDAHIEVPHREASSFTNPLEMILLIELRDVEAQTQQVVNRIYIVAAGLFAGLLAIGAFWFITMRIILSPVRLLRDVAAKVSGGDIDIRSDINTGDEFEELSHAFNNMLANQKEKQDQLRSINKSLDLKLDQLSASNVALYEANKVKGEFLANVSHELRTPLNSMIGFAEVLQETLADRTGPIDEKRKRYVANIINASRRLLDLINDLLDLAKIEAGRIDVHVNPISISDTCEGLVNLIRLQAEKRNITLRVRIEPNLPIVKTDASKLQQILFNFLANAVKFTPNGGVVTLAAALIPATRNEQAQLRISISDTGPGIPQEDHARIFEKFTQLDPTVTREHGGTGLGLTISKDLAGILQGKIEIDSDMGKGATFSLTIPLVLEQRSAPLMPETQSDVSLSENLRREA